jgi:hypothetical protein
MQKLKLALAAAAALALLAGPADAARKPPPLLKGVVGPDFRITLKTAAGKKVTALKAGRYRVRVTDRSAAHNFRLRGPRVNRQITGVGYRGTKTVTVRLKKGRYTFVCDPHTFDMRGSFRVR